MTNPFAPQLLYTPGYYADAEPPMPPADTWIMEPKLDGWRFVFHITEDRRVDAYGRNGGSMKAYRLPTYLTDELLNRFPPDTIVDTELVVIGEGMQSTNVATVLANHRAGVLKAYVFDVMRAGGNDARELPLRQRRWLLEKALAFNGSSSPVQLTLWAKPSTGLFAIWTDPEGLAVEGAVLKRLDSPYSSGARNGDWIKLKPQRTADCRIVGLPCDGQGKFTGLVGAVEFEIEPGKIGRASGMTDAVRRDMTEHPERYLGCLAEFAYQTITCGGHLRHPQFRRLRPDLEIGS
jgi:bifunctional non-homologous end joining protein LigD